MKLTMLIGSIVFSLLLFVSGCDLAMLQNDQLIQTSSTMSLISEKLDVVQQGMTQWAEATGENLDKIAELNSDIDKYQDVIMEAKEKFDEAPTVIEGAIAANQISAPINPYAPYIDLILKTLVGVFGVGGATATTLAVKRGKENREVKNKYDATNKANDILRLYHPEIAMEHYKLIGDVRNGAISINNLQTKKERIVYETVEATLVESDDDPHHFIGEPGLCQRCQC